jgi:hypothetical protein
MIPNKIICHHSLTKDSGTVSWGAIRRYHIVDLGWKEIGYHCGVEAVTSGDHEYYEAIMGRMWDEDGAHTKGQNDESLGICFIGNYDIVSPMDDILRKGGQIISLWMRLYNIPMEEIYPHNHFADYKTCPGTKFDMDRLKTWIPT